MEIQTERMLIHITIDTCIYNMKNSRVRVIVDDAGDCRDCARDEHVEGHLISWLRFWEGSFRGRRRCLAFRGRGSQNIVFFLLLARD